MTAKGVDDKTGQEDKAMVLSKLSLHSATQSRKNNNTNVSKSKTSRQKQESGSAVHDNTKQTNYEASGGKPTRSANGTPTTTIKQSRTDKLKWRCGQCARCVYVMRI